MTLVDHDQVEEGGRELAENLLVIFRPGDCLIEAEIDLVCGVDAPLPVAGNGLCFCRKPGHNRPEWPKVVDHGLVDQHVAVGQEQNALLAARLPEPPDDLKGSIGLTGSRRHDEKDAVSAVGDGFDGRVDGVNLVVARRLAASIVEIALEDDGFRLGRQRLPGAIARPQVAGRREAFKTEGGFRLGARARPVVEDEAVAIGGKYEGDMQGLGVVQSLLHAVADGMGIVLGLDQGDGDVWFVIQNVVGPLAFAPADQLAAHDDAALREADLLADLRHLVPTSLSQSRCDELGADVTFAEAFPVHCYQSFASTGAAGAPCGKHRSRSSPMVRPASFAIRQVV